MYDNGWNVFGSIVKETERHNRYQSLWWWQDETIAHYGFPNSKDDRHPAGQCAQIQDYTDTYYALECSYPPSLNGITSVLCEFPRQDDHNYTANASGMVSIQKSIIKKVSSNVKLTVCPDGHLTHEFLSCDWRSACWLSDVRTSVPCAAPLTPLPPALACSDGAGRVPYTLACSDGAGRMPYTLACSDGVGRVPYTLVCDHRPDCPDLSDESFCRFTPCQPFLEQHCGDGQVGVEKG